MTYDEAKSLKRFQNLCNCGGYAWSMNGRPKEQPHVDYCPQREEYGQWYRALHSRDAAEPRAGT